MELEQAAGSGVEFKQPKRGFITGAKAPHSVVGPGQDGSESFSSFGSEFSKSDSGFKTFTASSFSRRTNIKFFWQKKEGLHFLYVTRTVNLDF